MEILADSLNAYWAQFTIWLPRVALALAAFVTALLVGGVLGRGVASALVHYRMSLTHAAFFRRLIAWAVAFLGLAIALDLVGLEAVAAGLIAGGGISAIALGFAFRGVGENLLAGLFLAINRPFRIDDVIQSGAMRGVVRGVELRYTHVRSADGRDIYIPSAEIFNNALVNFTRDGLQRISFTIGLDYGEDCEAACTAILEILSGTEGVLDSPGPTAFLHEFEATHVVLEAAFWIDTRDPLAVVAGMRSRAMERVRRMLVARGYTLSSAVSTAVALTDERSGRDT